MHGEKWPYNILRRWLPAAVILTIICLLIYATVQQAYRQSANDPQIQLSEDAAGKLAQGETPQIVITGKTVDIAKSLSPYLIVYDEGGTPVAGSGILNGKLPSVPAGVFDFTRQNFQDRVTWQPQPDVRSAIVITHFTGRSSGFALAGRSLREVEIRESRLSLIVLMAWLAGLFGTLIISLI